MRFVSQLMSIARLPARRTSGHLAVVVLLALFVITCSAAREGQGQYFQGHVTYRASGEGVTVFEVNANGAKIEIDNDDFIRLVDSPEQVPWEEPLVARIDAITVIQGEIPSSHYRTYSQKHYATLVAKDRRTFALRYRERGAVYFEKLDRWVRTGGEQDALADVVGTCMRLVALDIVTARDLGETEPTEHTHRTFVEACVVLTVLRANPWLEETLTPKWGSRESWCDASHTVWSIKRICGQKPQLKQPALARRSAVGLNKRQASLLPGGADSNWLELIQSMVASADAAVTSRD